MLGPRRELIPLHGEGLADILILLCCPALPWPPGLAADRSRCPRHFYGVSLHANPPYVILVKYLTSVLFNFSICKSWGRVLAVPTYFVVVK